MLFVVRAQAAIEGAAGLGAGLGPERAVAGLQPEFLRPPVIEIVADQRLLHAVIAAALEIEDEAVLDDDLGGHGREAGLAQAGGLPVEDIGSRLTLEAAAPTRWSRAIQTNA